MTLILARSSLFHGLMVTDRRVTNAGMLHDADANKNILFADKNAVVSIAYTGSAYIGDLPTDQWVVQTLTGLQFSEGYRGKGTVPAIIHSEYPTTYFGKRIRRFINALGDIRQQVLPRYREGWTASSFDFVIAGFEWNRGKVRPLILGLSKSPNENHFTLQQQQRLWYLPHRGRIRTKYLAAPGENLSYVELYGIESRLDSVWGDGKSGTPDDIIEHLERLFIEKIEDVSSQLAVVGPDCMVIRIPNPVVRTKDRVI